MCELLHLLPERAQSGSKPRCHSLTHGTKGEVAGRLSSLIGPYGRVRSDDCWMPRGFVALREAQLDKATDLLADEHRAQLRRWWLTVPVNASTPSFDIASTCIIGDRLGFLLIEAKAHFSELRGEEGGKRLKPPVSTPSLRNHARIGWCMADANLVLNDQTCLDDQTRLLWGLSRDSRYQMSNRFAWAWKLTELGFPVILVYLGFLNAVEMEAGGRLANGAEWERMVRDHADRHVPNEVWGEKWTLHGQTFVPIIKAIEQPLCCAAEAQ